MDLHKKMDEGRKICLHSFGPKKTFDLYFYASFTSYFQSVIAYEKATHLEIIRMRRSFIKSIKTDPSTLPSSIACWYPANYKG